MALKIHSNASYLSAPKDRSCVGGHLFLVNYINLKDTYMQNESVLTVAAIINQVMSSPAEE